MGWIRMYERACRLLRWLADAVDQGFVTFHRAQTYASTDSSVRQSAWRRQGGRDGVFQVTYEVLSNAEQAVITAARRDNMAMRRFDPQALYAALEAERSARGVTWKQIARETGVSVSTITRTRHGGRMEVDGVLALVGWLGVPVEAFTRETSF